MWTSFIDGPLVSSARSLADELCYMPVLLPTGDLVLSGTKAAVWRRWDQRSYSTPGSVSTGMGDRVGDQVLVREIYLSLTNHPGQLSLAIPLWVGTMSTGQRAVMLCHWKYRQIWCCLQVTLCDPYLSALEAFA